MATPIQQSLSALAADDDIIAASQQPAAGGEQSLTLVGGGTVVLDVPRHIVITSDADDSGTTFTVEGFSRGGRSMRRSVAGPNAGAVTIEDNWRDITSVKVDQNTVGNVKVGTTNTFDGPWIKLDPKETEFNVTMAGEPSAGASLTWGVEMTIASELDQTLGGIEARDDLILFDHGTLSGETTKQDGAQTAVVSAVRVAITGYSSGTLAFALLQAGP